MVMLTSIRKAPGCSSYRMSFQSTLTSRCVSLSFQNMALGSALLTIVLLVLSLAVGGVMTSPEEDISPQKHSPVGQQQLEQQTPKQQQHQDRAPSSSPKTKVKRAPTQTIDYPKSVSEVTQKLLINYNKQDPPIADRSTEVKIGIYVISVYSISEQTMDYQVSMYLRQQWNDPRLIYQPIRGKIKHIRLGNREWEKIWIPDTFLRNEKGAEFHGVTVENRMLKLNNDGTLWYVIKVSATLSCPMDLQNFPLDTQQCPMLFESFGYTMDVMSFAKLDNPIDVDENLQLPQFKIIRKETRDCSQNYTTGAYPCLEFKFVLRRDIGYFLIQVYVPSILVVILSWVSFWINVDASPARVSIGLLTVLTTTTMSGAARASLPRVSYIKAIDIWMIICLLFVFASLIEYAIVNTLARRTARPVKQPRSSACGPRPGPGAMQLGPGGDTMPRPVPGTLPRRDVEMGTPLQQSDRCGLGGGRAGLPPHDGDPKTASGPPVQNGPPAPERDGKFQARRVDKISRKAFPIAFLLFNVVYWAVYTRG